MLTMGVGATALAATEETPAAETQQVTEASEDSSASAAETDKPERSASRKGRKGSGGVNVISVAASVLDMEKDEVKEAVKDAKVGDLLLAENKLDEFKQAYLDTAKTKLDEAVAAGSKTQAEADEKYAEYEQKMAGYDGTTHLCGKADHSNMFRQEQQEPSDS